MKSISRLLLTVIAVCASLNATAQGILASDSANDDATDSRQESPQGAPPRDEGSRRVFKDRIAPHWFHDNTRFWYRNELRGGAKEFIRVNAEHGTRVAAFDHARLATS